MRYDVKKFLFVGIHDDNKPFFKKAQELGIIHFVNQSSTQGKEMPVDLQNLLVALKLLRGLPTLEQEENVRLEDADEIVNQILHLKEQLEKLNEEHRILNLEIARVGIFGDFSLETLEFIEREGKCKIQFFVGKTGVFHEAPMPEELIFIASEHNLDYFIAINDVPVAYDKLVEMKIDYPLGILVEKQHQVDHEIVQHEHRLKTFAKYSDLLHHALAAKMNKYNLHQAESCSQEVMNGSLFAVEGWVSVNQIDKLNDLVKANRVHYEEIAIEPADVVPTSLVNTGLSRIGEDLVHIYDTPSTTDKDPSLWVLLFFSLFFAFIIGDGGYGLIYLAIALYLNYKFSKAKGLGKRLLKLFAILGTACVIWGVMTTSFFGIPIDIDSPLRKVSLVHWLVEKKAEYLMHHQESSSYKEWVAKYPALATATSPADFIDKGVIVKNGEKEYDVLNRLSDNILLELALFIGVVHIIISFLRYIGRNWNGLGWIAFLIGAYLYFPYYLDTPSFLNFVFGIDLVKGSEAGYQLIFGGIATAVILAIVKNGWMGLLEVMSVIQVFADILSYLRLYALGLAGAIVGSTINEMAGVVPAVVAVFLILGAHMINMLLGIMSGVIHGLRLNFLEWYHYSFEGGGKQFQPLHLLEVKKNQKGS